MALPVHCFGCIYTCVLHGLPMSEGSVSIVASDLCQMQLQAKQDRWFNL